ncbi:glucose-6-phosphate dehydrogenase assembly protein OpcA [Spirochaetia bacterium 38H-sp]|uniref:Glucose-6-phosphate dehydrogenase assembly protein OpcA n=1 Tax=Rarispira pelagica TaxID=3141764 RepID=A0ABU9U8E6_9SPIR
MEKIVKPFFEPARIEKQLAELHKSASPGDERDLLFNLILVSSQDTEKKAATLLDGLMGKRSARIIHIKHTDNAESSLRLSARCSLDRAKRGVCFQEIVIENGKDNAGFAPGTWTGLLVRDLPVIALWLPTADTMQDLFIHLEDHVDKIIIDFWTLEKQGLSPEDFISQMELLAPDSLAILSDIHWHRLLDMRRKIALFMDENKLCDNHSSIKKITLSGVSSSTFFLIKNWLIDRLGWKNTEPAPEIEKQNSARPELIITADTEYKMHLAEPDDSQDVEILRQECDNPEPDGFFLQALHVSM